MTATLRGFATAGNTTRPAPALDLTADTDADAADPPDWGMRNKRTLRWCGPGRGWRWSGGGRGQAYYGWASTRREARAALQQALSHLPR